MFETKDCSLQKCPSIIGVFCYAVSDDNFHSCIGRPVKHYENQVHSTLILFLQAPSSLDPLAGQLSTGELSWESLSSRNENTTGVPPTGRGTLRVVKKNFSTLTKIPGGSVQFCVTDSRQSYPQLQGGSTSVTKRSGRAMTAHLDWSSQAYHPASWSKWKHLKSRSERP